MQIEEKGSIESFEPMPTEKVLYLTAIKFDITGLWMAGPSGMDKNLVIQQLEAYHGVELVRIYSVKVPVKSLPAA